MTEHDAVPPGAPDPGTLEPGGHAPAQQCPWCAAATTAAATRCAACGAALAQRETIGDLMIPGLTSVDPALQDYDRRPLHISGPSPSQGMVPALIVGAIHGGPIGIAAIGGVAAVAAVEYLGAGGGGTGRVDLEDVGRPSEVVLRALDRLDDGTLAPEGTATSAGGQTASLAGAPTPTVAGAASTSAPADGGVDPAAVDQGLSIWRDLPPVDAVHQPADEEAIDGRG